MDDYIQIRISADVKDKFRKLAEKNNPGIPKRQVMSIVLRTLIHEYVKEHEKEP